MVVTAWLALLLDRLIGDPNSRWHPVVLIGSWITICEKALYNTELGVRGLQMGGLLLWIIVVVPIYFTVQEVEKVLAAFSPLVQLGLKALALSFVICTRSLAAVGQEISALLARGELTAARHKVGWIVGRDTEGLDEGEVTRATVESVAENIVDGVLSPLFYFFLGGLPLAFAYRAVNTLDSMVGYKNDRYLHFGMASARLDDLFNWVPARLTAVLVICCAYLLNFDARGSMLSVWQDARKHPSPNSGFPEAAVAGALGIRLGGWNSYGGVKSFRSYMGSAKVPINGTHIIHTIWLLYGSVIVFLLFATSLYYYKNIVELFS